MDSLQAKALAGKSTCREERPQGKAPAGKRPAGIKD